MKKLVIAMVLINAMVFAQNHRAPTKRAEMKNMKRTKYTKKMSPEKYMEIRKEEKYSRIKKMLKKKDAKLVMPIIKKYDKKIFELMKPQQKAMRKLKESEYANCAKKLELTEKGIDLKIKVLKLRKKELKEIKATGIDKSVINRIIMSKGMGNIGHKKMGHMGHRKMGHMEHRKMKNMEHRKMGNMEHRKMGNMNK